MTEPATLLAPEKAPKFVAAVSGGGGLLLLVAPRVFTGSAGLEGHDHGVRAAGLADLFLVPGLAGSGPKAPWMAGRAALSLMQAAYFDSTAGRAKKPRVAKGAALMLLGLAVMDGLTALALHRAEDTRGAST